VKSSLYLRPSKTPNPRFGETKGFPFSKQKFEVGANSKLFMYTMFLQSQCHFIPVAYSCRRDHTSGFIPILYKDSGLMRFLIENVYS